MWVCFSYTIKRLKERWCVGSANKYFVIVLEFTGTCTTGDWIGFRIFSLPGNFLERESHN